MSRPRWVDCRLPSALLLSAALTAPLGAQEAVRLQEQFPAGYQYHVEVNSRLSGRFKQMNEKGEATGQPLALSGESLLNYDERILETGASGIPQKTLRLYRRIEMQKSDGQQQVQIGIRPEVRRVVIARLKFKEVAFSPDGPLTAGEIDLISNDVFTPALVGLFSPNPVKPGDRWPAARSAVEELTEVEEVNEGGIDCTFEKVETLANRRHAVVRVSGTVKGVDQDGPVRHQFDGTCYFDLESRHLSYLSFKAVKWLLDAKGQENGRVEGQWVITRQANCDPADLRPEALRGVSLEPTDDTTLIRYDNPDLGVQFLHPRRWRVAEAQGHVFVLEEPKGGGIQVTLEPPQRVPTAAQLLQEMQTAIVQKKGRLTGRDDPRRLRGAPQELDHFALSAEMDGRRALLDYYILRQTVGGATAVAYLPATAEQAALRKDAQRIMQSLTLTRAITELKGK
jgi:hypothetical protein